MGLNLVLAENLGAVNKIVRFFPSLEDVFKARKQDLISLGLDGQRASHLASTAALDRAEEEIECLERRGYSILTIEDEDYPEYLKEIFDAPIVLYCAGNVKLLKEPIVAIVGARTPTPYGRGVAERLARDLASRGIVIASGLAYGIDTMAHWGALSGGKTVAVLGSGFDRVYPRENKRLFEKIVESGAVITEYPSKFPPHGLHFPLRNRIISGLSLALVVVEAAQRSGSLISARLALEQNRNVMAVPGNVTSELSVGANALIKAGAKPVASWEDIVEELPFSIQQDLYDAPVDSRQEGQALTEREKKIYGLLCPDSLTHIDELVEKSDLAVSEVLTLLFHLEIKGFVMQHPGKLFQRKL